MLPIIEIKNFQCLMKLKYSNTRHFSSSEYVVFQMFLRNATVGEEGQEVQAQADHTMCLWLIIVEIRQTKSEDYK